jgi:hypothetical protein
MDWTFNGKFGRRHENLLAIIFFTTANKIVIFIFILMFFYIFQGCAQISMWSPKKIMMTLTLFHRGPIGQGQRN